MLSPFSASTLLLQYGAAVDRSWKYLLPNITLVKFYFVCKLVHLLPRFQQFIKRINRTCLTYMILAVITNPTQGHQV
jgi:hypothetical protein